MQIELGMSKGQLVALQFGQVNVAASQSDVQLTGAGVSGAADGYVVPFNGQILAVTYALSAAATAGSWSWPHWSWRCLSWSRSRRKVARPDPISRSLAKRGHAGGERSTPAAPDPPAVAADRRAPV